MFVAKLVRFFRRQRKVQKRATRTRLMVAAGGAQAKGPAFRR